MFRVGLSASKFEDISSHSLSNFFEPGQNQSAFDALKPSPHKDSKPLTPVKHNTLKSYISIDACADPFKAISPIKPVKKNPGLLRFFQSGTCDDPFERDERPPRLLDNLRAIGVRTGDDILDFSSTDSSDIDAVDKSARLPGADSNRSAASLVSSHHSLLRYVEMKTKQEGAEVETTPSKAACNTNGNHVSRDCHDNCSRGTESNQREDNSS